MPHVERKAMRKCRYIKRVSKLCKESACVRQCESAPNVSDVQVDTFWAVCQIWLACVSIDGGREHGNPYSCSKSPIANTDAASASDTHNEVFVPEHGNE